MDTGEVFGWIVFLIVITLLFFAAFLEIEPIGHEICVFVVVNELDFRILLSLDVFLDHFLLKKVA